MRLTSESTAVVLAGGGERVIAWEVGVLAGLADAGVDLRDAGMIVGTSAGSYVAARLAAGEDPRAAADEIAAYAPRPVAAPDVLPFEALADVFAAAGTIGEGRRRIGAFARAAQTISPDESIARLADRLPSAGWSRALRLVGVDGRAGERVTLDAASGVPVATGVAASRALPGALPPIEVDGRPLIDGAVGSGTNADVVITPTRAVSRVVIVVTMPTDSPKLCALWEEALRAELCLLDEAGIETYLIRADAADLDAMGPDFMNGGRGPLAVRAGREAGQSVGPALRRVLEPRAPRPGAQRRRRRTAVALTLLGAAAFASSAQAAVEVGTVGTSPRGDGQSCTGMVFQETVEGSTNYVVPNSGVITRWSAMGGSEAGALAALMVADGDQIVGESGATTLPKNAPGNFNVRVPVRAGDTIGLAAISGSDICGTRAGSGNVAARARTEVSAGQRFTVTDRVSPLLVNVKARIEPDADRDGFGDETQDECPTDARTQSKCVGQQPGTPPAQPENPAPPTPRAPAKPDAPKPPVTPRPPVRPGDPTPVAPPRDTVAPRVAARGARRQRLARSRRLVLRAAPSEAVALVASARVNVRGVRLRAVRASAASGERVTLRIRASKASARRLRAALGRKRRVVATVRVVARDAAGNATTQRLRIRIVG